MVTPIVKQIRKDDIDFARAWLRKCVSVAPRRSWLDVEHSMEKHYPGGILAWLNRPSDRLDDYDC